MAKKSEARNIIHLACPECKERTYTTVKNKKNDPGRLELKKYCPRCRKNTLHKETK
jgi:large subunit ribosomal protein L33